MINPPITGLKIIQRKNDHSVPGFFFFPIFSEIINDKIYQMVKTNIIIISFILNFI